MDDHESDLEALEETVADVFGGPVQRATEDARGVLRDAAESGTDQGGDPGSGRRRTTPPPPRRPNRRTDILRGEAHRFSSGCERQHGQNRRHDIAGHQHHVGYGISVDVTVQLERLDCTVVERETTTVILDTVGITLVELSLSQSRFPGEFAAVNVTLTRSV